MQVTGATAPIAEAGCLGASDGIQYPPALVYQIPRNRLTPCAPWRMAVSSKSTCMPPSA